MMDRVVPMLLVVLLLVSTPLPMASPLIVRRVVDDLDPRTMAGRVARIELDVGPLSGVEPDLLRRAYPLAIAGTCEQVVPPLIELDAGHEVACHLYPAGSTSMGPVASGEAVGSGDDASGEANASGDENTSSAASR